MIDQATYDRVAATLPFLAEADSPLRREFRDAAFLARIPAGRDVFIEGDHSEAIALVLSGVVRVYKIGETGREITLYRFGDGESCMLTANAILSQETFPAIATVEEDVEAVMVPAENFRDWVRRSELWQTFVFRLLSQRLASIMITVDNVAFRRLDVRLAEFLLAQARSGDTVHMTHQEIAAEVGSSREVISRTLEALASDGLIERRRGVIEIIDRPALESRARL